MNIHRNRAQCTLCGDILESQADHDVQTCSCGNLSVDGGLTHLSRSSREKDSYIELSDLSHEKIPVSKELHDSLEALVHGIEIDLDAPVEQEPTTMEEVLRDRLDQADRAEAKETLIDGKGFFQDLNSGKYDELSNKVKRARDIAKTRKSWEERYSDPDARPDTSATAAEIEYYLAVQNGEKLSQESPTARLVRRVNAIRMLTDTMQVDLDVPIEQKSLTVEELRVSFDRAREEAEGGELKDVRTFLAELDRLEILIDLAYEACVLAYDELCDEDQVWLNEHPRDRIVGHEFFELRVLQKEIARARKYANTPENRALAKEQLAIAKKRKRPKIIKGSGEDS